MSSSWEGTHVVGPVRVEAEPGHRNVTLDMARMSTRPSASTISFVTVTVAFPAAAASPLATSTSSMATSHSVPANLFHF